MNSNSNKVLEPARNYETNYFRVIEIVTRNGEYRYRTFNIDNSLNPYFLASNVGYKDFLFISERIDICFIKNYA